MTRAAVVAFAIASTKGPLTPQGSSSRFHISLAALGALVAAPLHASTADSIHVTWRRDGAIESSTLPAGSHGIHAVVKDRPLAATTALAPDVPGAFIVRFAAPPTASARRRGANAVAPTRARTMAIVRDARAPWERFLADLPGLAGPASRTDAAPGVRVRRRLEVSFNGAAVIATRAIAERMRRLPYVSGVYPDDSVRAVLDGSDAQIEADSLRQALGLTGAGVVVSIVDTGVDYTHPALGGCLGPGCRVIGGWDFANDDADPLDDHGHGTHVAGIAGGRGLGLDGIAPGVRFLAFKVLAASGGGTMSDVIAGIDRSLDPDGDPFTDDAADVINLSVGSLGDADDPVSQAVDQAVQAGVVCVAAAGNMAAYRSILSPGCARQAITVGAVTAQDQVAAFSSRGPAGPDEAIKPDVVAPGVDIRATWLQGGQRVLSGTSMATPHVSGVAALLLERHPQWTPEAVKAALMNTAADLGAGPFAQGAGRIDALAAGTADVAIAPASLSFGLAPAAAPVWSAPRMLTVRNDAAEARTVALTVVSNLPPGTELEVAPASVVLAPGEAREITATLTLSHAPAVGTPPHAYAGEIQARVGTRTLRVPFAVVRTPQLVIQVDDVGLVIVHDRVRTHATALAAGPGTLRLFLPSGTYDVMGALGYDARVVREGVVLAESTAVDLRAAGAVHALRRECVDQHGIPIEPPVGIETLRHRATGIGFVSFGGMASTTRFNTIGPDYEWEWHRLSYGQEPVTYDFQGYQRGIAASATVRNAPSDLRRVTLAFHPSPELGRIVPVRWVSDGPRGVPLPNAFAVTAYTFTAPFPSLAPPFTQEAWFTAPPEGVRLRARQVEGRRDTGGAPSLAGVPDVKTPYLIAAPGQPLRGYLLGDDVRPVLTLAGERLVVGGGPPAWFGAFHNGPNALGLAPAFGSGAPLLLAQHGGTRDLGAIPFTLSRAGVVVETGTLTGGLARTLATESHTLTLACERFPVAGAASRTTVEATFHSGSADPDPPFVRDLAVLVGGAPAGIVATGAAGVVRFTAGDGVAFSEVTLASRLASATAWTTLALARSGELYEAPLPTARAGALALRIEARDAAGNRLVQTIEPAAVLEGPDVVDPNLVGNGGFETSLTGWSRYGSATLTLAAEGRSSARSLQIRASSSSTFGCDDVPNWIAETAAKGAIYRIAAWVKTPTGSRGRARIRVYEYVGSTQQGSTASSSSVTLSATWTLLTLDYVVRAARSTLSLRVTDEPSSSSETFLVDDVSVVLLSRPPDAAPVVTAPAAAAGTPGSPITFTVTAADADGPAIATLAAGGMPAGATFTPNTARTQGTFAWTPLAVDVRAAPYPIVFTATNALAGCDTTLITVSAAPPNLCGNGTFESGTSGWGPYGSATLAAVPGGRTGNALQVGGSSSFGIDDGPDWLPAPLTKGAVYRIRCHVKGVGSARGTAKIRVYEYLGSSQQGSTAYSPTVTLGTTWQALTVEYGVRTEGSRLSLRVTDAASSAESFLVDDVVIERLGASVPQAGALAWRDVPSMEALTFGAAFAPNPARTEGVLSFTLTRTGPARVDLFDPSGRHVAKLVQERALEPGTHRVRVAADPRAGLPAGVYFYKVVAREGEIRGRLTLLR